MEQDRVKRTGGRTKLWLLSLIWLLWCICCWIILCFPFDECRKWFTCNCYFPTDLLIGPRQGGRLDQLLMTSDPSHCLVAAAHSFESCCSLGRERKLKWYVREQWQTCTAADRPAAWPLELMQIAVSCTLTRSRSACPGWCYGFTAAEVTSISQLTGKQACKRLVE